MSEKTADTVNTLLRDVIDSGTGQEAGLNDRDSAGKTGTTDERKNAWFVGYTPNMSGAVWVGSARQDVQMSNITIGGTFHPLVFGGGVPGPIWRDAMSGALVGKDAPDFNTVDIPDDEEKGDGRGDNGDGDGDDGRQGTPGGGLIGGLFGGLTGGNGGNGGRPGAGKPEAEGAGEPGAGERERRTPELSLPLHDSGAAPSKVRPHCRVPAQPWSCCFTIAATRPPSACPATLGFTIFMTAPMARGPSAPPALASSTAWETIAVSSSSESCLGR